jgi:hypothetical protein
MSAEPKRPANQPGQRGMSPLEREHVGMLGCQGWRVVSTGSGKAPSVADRPPAATDRAQEIDRRFE